MGNIRTHGNRCFTNGAVAGAAEVGDAPIVAKRPSKKTERVNFKFGKVRVSVTNAKRVKVRQELTDGVPSLIIEVPESAKSTLHL